MALGSLSDLLQTMDMPVTMGPQPAATVPVSVTMPTMAPQPQVQPQSQHHGLLGGLGGILGRIGDALLVANGGEPAYANKIKNRQIGDAVASYLGNSDAALAAIFQQDPQAGLALYKMKHPEVAQAPEIIRDYQYYNSLPETERPNFERVMQIMHPGMIAPITLGPNDTYESGASTAPALPHVTDQQSYDAIPNGAKYTTPDGSVRVKGGQTATPSGGFLDAVTSKNESGGHDFTPSGAPVTSSAGAKYAMQVLPSTAADPGFGVAPAKGDSPAEFNRVGREYRSALLQKYGGNLARMWAAYNMGPGALDNALAKYGDDWLSHVPQGVRSYVSSNLKSAGAL